MMGDKIPYADIVERIKSDIEEAYQRGLEDGKRIEREDIFKTIEKFADNDVDYDNITIADFKIIMEITKRLQKIR